MQIHNDVRGLVALIADRTAERDALLVAASEAQTDAGSFASTRDSRRAGELTVEIDHLTKYLAKVST